MARPILWSFRRCPYAMRARLALAVSGQRVELREVVLRDKPDAFLATSPTATVPCLDTGVEVIDESLDIMLWALRRHDPGEWLDMPPEGHDLIAWNDGPFKTALDRYKYVTRHKDVDIGAERSTAVEFLARLDGLLGHGEWLFGKRPGLADMAILPFVRQFAHVDLCWFHAQPLPHVARWLAAFKSSGRFAAIMRKYPPWTPGAPAVLFPDDELKQT
ncbi:MULTISPECIES: glutathione S-transferase [unclassified Roseovarius]|uniref:glutathione S-transferase n=1 Tax=unclassified Roseovarius TaxID=2614913 RepID=UPI00273FF4CB|nr:MULTISPECIES: glutathione S-transferase [unclassified Roseovarius]